MEVTKINLFEDGPEQSAAVSILATRHASGKLPAHLKDFRRALLDNGSRRETYVAKSGEEILGVAQIIWSSSLLESPIELVLFAMPVEFTLQSPGSILPEIVSTIRRRHHNRSLEIKFEHLTQQERAVLTTLQEGRLQLVRRFNPQSLEFAPSAS